jgi:hypothetical protein
MSLGLKSGFCRLLLRLHREEATGVIVLKEGERQLAVYVKGGDIVYADGIDKESILLKEIASRKKLDREDRVQLGRLLEEEPLYFGRTLIERNLISKPDWHRFLDKKVRAVVASALDMEDPEILFNQSELGILPVNFVHCPIPPLLLQETRKFENLKGIQDYLLQQEPRFCPQPDCPSLNGAPPFTSSEARLLSILDGEKGWQELLEETGTTLEELTRDLYVLFSLGLIEQAPPAEGSNEEKAEYRDMILLYLSLIGTMKNGFRDKGFSEMVRKALADATGPVKTLFHDLVLVSDDKEAVVQEVLRRFNTLGSLINRRLVLLTAFNKLIYLLLLRIKKAAGKIRVEFMLEQMMKTLLQAEESKKYPDLMLYLLGNLEDYAKQMGSP